jgi:hypothetical protein
VDGETSGGGVSWHARMRGWKPMNMALNTSVADPGGYGHGAFRDLLGNACKLIRYNSVSDPPLL